MFEETVDALFTLLDLDESNGLCEDEFEVFIKSFKESIETDSRFYARFQNLENPKFDFQTAKGCLEDDGEESVEEG